MIKKVLILCCAFFLSAHATPVKTKSMRFRRKSSPTPAPAGIGAKWNAIKTKWDSVKSVLMQAGAPGAAEQITPLIAEVRQLVEQTKTECAAQAGTAANMPQTLENLKAFVQTNAATIAATTACPAGPIQQNPIDLCGFIHLIDSTFTQLLSCPGGPTATTQ